MIYEEQPGLTVTRENNKLHAKVDPDKFGRQKMNLQSQNEEKIRVLQAEIERLAVLLKVIKNFIYNIGYICFVRIFLLLVDLLFRNY